MGSNTFSVPHRSVERFIQTFKNAMKAAKNDGRSLQQSLDSFTLTYRTTPHATTSQAPCVLFLQCHLRTLFDLLKPDLEKQVVEKQADQIVQHDQHVKHWSFSTGQKVTAKNFRPGIAWVVGKIEKQLGPLSYLVRIQSNLVWKQVWDLNTPINVSWIKNLKDILENWSLSSCACTNLFKMDSYPVTPQLQCIMLH